MLEKDGSQDAGERIEELLAKLAQCSDDRALGWSEELLSTVTEFYGAGLARIVELCSHPSAEPGEVLLDRLGEDPLVASLLLLHRLHPKDTATRIEEALQSIRLSVGDGDVRLIALDELSGKATVRVLAGESIPVSSSALVSRTRRAVEEAAPELAQVEVDIPLTATPVSISRHLAGDRPRDALNRQDLMPQQGLAGGVRVELRPRRAKSAQVEHCELCATEVPSEHDHIVELNSRRLICSCRACYLLFTEQGAAGGRYRSVPDRYIALTDLSLSRARWQSLQIPVSMAFLFANSDVDQVVAFYPSPAGATECLLPLGTWEELAADDPVLLDMATDVEALLVKMDGQESECFIVPIDDCYELVGRLRRSWKGFDGGPEAREQIDAFFARIRSRAQPISSRPSSSPVSLVTLGARRPKDEVSWGGASA